MEQERCMNFKNVLVYRDGADTAVLIMPQTPQVTAPSSMRVHTGRRPTPLDENGATS
jgi:hypothetical protein